MHRHSHWPGHWNRLGLLFDSVFIISSCDLPWLQVCLLALGKPCNRQSGWIEQQHLYPAGAYASFARIRLWPDPPLLHEERSMTDSVQIPQTGFHKPDEFRARHTRLPKGVHSSWAFLVKGIKLGATPPLVRLATKHVVSRFHQAAK